MQKNISILAALSCLLLARPSMSEDNDAGVGRMLSDLGYVGTEAETDYQRQRCKLDLYLPQRESGFATLIWFHGGALKGGDKSGPLTVQISKRFAREGVAVAAVNYRLHPQVTYPAYIEDAARSFAWVRENISRYGGDPERIFVSGHSAGGYLSAMLGMDPRYLRKHGLETEAIAGLIPISGQMVTHSTVREERGIPRATPVIDAGAASYHARPDAPPCLLICGGEDLPARAAENIYFAAVMKAAGHKGIDYLEVAGRNHLSIASQIRTAGDVVAEAMLNFIGKHSPAKKKGSS